MHPHPPKGAVSRGRSLPQLFLLRACGECGVQSSQKGKLKMASVLTTHLILASRFVVTFQANDEGDYFPLWGTCLGFELLGYLAAGEDYSIVTPVDALNISLPINFSSGMLLLLLLLFVYSPEAAVICCHCISCSLPSPVCNPVSSSVCCCL